jgi:hypothetical protein
MKTVYKVCLIKNNEFTSVCHNDNFPEHFRVYYRLNQESHPKVSGTKLFVFDSLVNAKKFTSWLFSGQYTYMDCAILKCTTQKTWKPKYLSTIKQIENFWKLKRKHKKIPLNMYYTDVIPTGTLCCNSLTPIERVL